MWLCSRGTNLTEGRELLLVLVACPCPHQSFYEEVFHMLVRGNQSWRPVYCRLAEASCLCSLLQWRAEEGEQWVGIGGTCTRDCGGPVEGAEEGHERSSIVSVEAASAGFHLQCGQLINKYPLNGRAVCQEVWWPRELARQIFPRLASSGNILARHLRGFSKYSATVTHRLTRSFHYIPHQ